MKGKFYLHTRLDRLGAIIFYPNQNQQQQEVKEKKKKWRVRRDNILHERLDETIISHLIKSNDHRNST